MQTVIEEFHALCQKHDIKSKCDFEIRLLDSNML